MAEDEKCPFGGVTDDFAIHQPGVVGHQVGKDGVLYRLRLPTGCWTPPSRPYPRTGYGNRLAGATTSTAVIWFMVKCRSCRS